MTLPPALHTPRIKKIIGSLLIMAFLAGYIWLASTLGGLLPDNMLAKSLFYAVVGIGWGIPLIPLLSWMNKEPEASE
jgi:hypothetical protein